MYKLAEGIEVAGFKCQGCGKYTPEHWFNRHGDDRGCFWCIIERDLFARALEEPKETM